MEAAGPAAPGAGARLHASTSVAARCPCGPGSWREEVGARSLHRWPEAARLCRRHLLETGELPKSSGCHVLGF